MSNEFEVTTRQPDGTGKKVKFVVKDGTATPISKIEELPPLTSAELAANSARSSGVNGAVVLPPLPRKSRLVCANDVIMRATEWVWFNRVPRASLTLLTGLPGSGKTQLGAEIAGHLTTGEPWPDSASVPKRWCAPTRCGVIYLTAEDTLNATMVPRLVAAKADLLRVNFLPLIKIDDTGKKRAFLLSKDLEDLEVEIDFARDIGAIILDPITA